MEAFAEIKVHFTTALHRLPMTQKEEKQEWGILEDGKDFCLKTVHNAQIYLILVSLERISQKRQLLMTVSIFARCHIDIIYQKEMFCKILLITEEKVHYGVRNLSGNLRTQYHQ